MPDWTSLAQYMVIDAFLVCLHRFVHGWMFVLSYLHVLLQYRNNYHTSQMNFMHVVIVMIHVIGV